MNKFKIGDIVVTLVGIRRIPKNLITKVTEIKTMKIYNGIDCSIQGENEYRDNSKYSWIKNNIRHATIQEQFLYHIFGPHVLGEENE